MAQVKLHVYDLTNGLAKQVSPSLVGRIIEGVWHTSIVAFGKEIFYGRGICVTNPGESHHGSPLRIVEMGQTHIDEETFWEYVEGIREMYTADKYHLLDFNCNSFTEDLVGFLTGGSIPKYIKDLPSDFLETPFGRALRPTIDSMFPGTASSSQAPSLSPQSRPTTRGTGGIGTLTSPIHILNTKSHLDSFLSSHAASVILFTSATCPPCRAIAPVYERLAAEHTSLKHAQSQGSSQTSTLKWKGAGKRIGFAKADVSLGPEVAQEFGIQATPTFIFLEGKQFLSELKGADQYELTRRVEDLSSFVQRASKGRLEELVESDAGRRIIYDKAPPFDVVRGKIGDEDGISGKVCDKLKAKGAFGNELVAEWVGLTERVIRPDGGQADLDRVWPSLDLWRVGVLSDPDVAKAVTSILPLLFELLACLQGGSESKAEKNTRLIAMRLVSNVLSLSAAGGKVASSPVEVPPSFLVPSLLSDDTALRTCAAGVCLLLSSKARMGGDHDAEWNVEVFCALVEVLGREDLDLSSPSKAPGKSKEASTIGGKDRDGVKRIITCLAVLLLSAREDLLDLVDALGLVEVVRRRKAGGIDEEVKELLTELEGLMSG